MANATYADTASARETLVEYFRKHGLTNDQNDRIAPGLQVINEQDQSYTYDSATGAFYIGEDLVTHGEVYEALLQI